MLPVLTKVHDPLAALRKELHEAACSGQATVPELRRIAVEGALKVRGAMVECAKASGSSGTRLARNVAATVPAGVIGLFGALMKHWSVTDPFETAEEHRALVEALPVEPGTMEMTGWLLADGKPPSQACVAAFFLNDLRALLLFEREMRPAGNKRTVDDTVGFLKSVLGTRPGNSHEGIRQILIGDGFARGMKRLDEQAFKKLPTRLRRWILADPAFLKSALAGPLVRRILKAPESHPDTPQALSRSAWLGNYPKALEDLRSGHPGTASVAMMLGNERFANECSDEILEALHRGISSTGQREPVRRSPSVDASRSSGSGRLQLVFGFFSRPPESRLEVARDQPPAAIDRLVKDVTEPEWISAFLHSRDDDALACLRPRLLRRKSLRDGLFGRLAEEKTSDECRSVFARDVMILGDRTTVMSLLSHHPSLLGKIDLDDLARRSMCRIVADHLKDAGRFMVFVSNADKYLPGAVMTSTDPALRAARARLMRAARLSKDPGLRLTVFRLALVHAPSLLTASPALRVSEDEFRRLLDSSRSPVDLPVLFRLTGKRGAPAWEACFLKGGSNRLIRRNILKHLPWLLPRLEELHAARLLEQPEFRSRLQRVLAGKVSAGSIGVSQRMLRHFIPWARKRWKSKPTIAVAHELALAFSIADARYLAFLCAERWNSPDRDRGGHVFDHHYRVHPLPKKSGGTRLVTVPSDPLKRLQRRILRSGLDELFLHPAAHGFRSGRSILTNALPHVGQPCVVNVDIRSFFPATRHPLILRACSLPAAGILSEGARRVLADLCSHAGGLPTGAPTSPVLANLILRAADSSIAKAAEANNIIYTRYADDLTFSGGTNVLKILPFVSKILGQLGYELDGKKTNIYRRGRRQVVTGLVVNEKPNLPRRIRRRLRAAVHLAATGGTPHWQGKPTTTAKLLGRLGHLSLVQREEAASLRRKLAHGDTPGHPDS